MILNFSVYLIKLIHLNKLKKQLTILKLFSYLDNKNKYSKTKTCFKILFLLLLKCLFFAMTASVSVRGDGALNFFWRSLIMNSGKRYCMPEYNLTLSYNTTVLGQMETLQITFRNVVGAFCEFSNTFPLDISLSNITYDNNASLYFDINLSGQLILRSDVEVNGKFINAYYKDVRAFVDFEALITLNFTNDNSEHCQLEFIEQWPTKFDNIVVQTNDGNEQAIWSAVANSDKIGIKLTLCSIVLGDIFQFIFELDLSKRLTQWTA